MFKKLKNWGKTIAFISGAVALGSIFIAALSYKYSSKFKPSFYNYRSYMSKENIKQLSKTFEYKQFNEISEFNTALISNKAVAGIGSDFQAVSLIKKGKLAKINYSELLDMPNLKEEDYGKALQTILRPEIWSHLNDYNNELKTDEFGNPYSTPQHLWQYFMPYFSQDAVIAYNILKNPIKPENLKDDDTGSLNFDKYKTNGYNPYQMINIMKILSENGFNNWVITDAMRDNLLYGSAYSLNLKTQKRDDSQFTGNVFSDTYKTLTDNFVSLIKDGTGYSVNDTSHINFKGDGLELLNDLINPNSKVNAAIMYNGDAIDAYYSKDNFENVEDGTAIRIVRPIKNILLLDGLVISSSNHNTSVDEYSKITGETIFQNSALPYKIKLENPNLTMEQVNRKATEDYYLNFKTNELNDELNQIDVKINLKQIRNYLITLLSELDKKRVSASIDDEIDQLNLNAKLSKEYYADKVKAFLTKIDNSKIDNDSINLEALKKIAKNNLDDLVITLAYVELQKDNNDFNDVEEDKKQEQLVDQISNSIAWISLANNNANPEWRTNFFSKKYLNIDNFDYINYVPVTQLDYKFIESNYFYNGDGTVDNIALNIYKLDSKEDTITHAYISSIGDSLYSDVSFYYYQKTKS